METPVPKDDPGIAEAPGEAPEVSCEQARKLSDLALDRPLPVAIRRKLREHWDGCEACAQRHAEAARALIRRGVDDRRAEPRDRLTPIWAPMRRRQHRFVLKFVALCAIVAGLSQTLGSWDRDPTCRVIRTAGQAWIGGYPMEEEIERAWRSDVLVTGPNGAARLEVGQLVLELGPLTEVLVESTLTKRLRLMGGELTAEGTATLQCAFGVLELEDARARLVSDDSSLRLELESGEAGWITAGGRLPIVPGERLVAAPGTAERERF